MSILLNEHGAPQAQVDERCKIAFEKLGRQAIIQAFRSPRPWQEIKALANAQLPKLQLILPSELAASTKARLDDKTEFGHKKTKQPHDKKQPVVIQLRPEDLSIPGMIFKQGSDEAVQHIPFSAIGVDAKGVIPVTAEQAKPYLALPQPISRHGLAKHVSETCEMKSRRPTSSSFARWNKCVRMSVSKRHMLAVDDLWRGFGILPIKHVTSSFREFKVHRSA